MRAAKPLEERLKQKGPKQQSPTRGGQRGGEQRSRAPARGVDRELVGRSYETGTALRSPRAGERDADPSTAPVESTLTTAARSLHVRHGEQISEGAARHGVPEEAAAAVVLAETANLPGLHDEQMPIRFEPYAFYQRTGTWLVATHKDQEAEYRVFREAAALEPEAAHESLRMGVAQLSGAEAGAAGFESAQAMFAGLDGSQAAQIDGMFNLIGQDLGLREAMGQADWQRVAELRAGPGYGALGYDDALAANAAAYGRAMGKPGYGGGDDDDDKDKPKRKRARRRRTET